MAKSEIYKLVKTVQINGFTHSEIQGTCATVAQSPFRDGHIPQFAVIGIETAGDDTDNLKKDDKSTLRKISSIHGRSYEFVTGSENAILWADEYGNIFTALNTKGNNISAPDVCKSSSAPSGFLIYGLQESDAVVRVLKASQLFRSNNIDTEAVIKVIEPLELPYNGRNVSLPEFKRKLVQKVWEENAHDGQKSDRLGHLVATRQDIAKLSSKLEDMTFFETIRATQVNERLVDLGLASDLERITMLRKAFRFVNIYEEAKAAIDSSYIPDKFSVEKQEDIDRYLNEYLPKRIARNFTKMHKLGLVHGFLHTGNVSTVGSLYDLDSVKGEPLGLGDESVAKEAITQDIYRFLIANSGFPSAGKIIEVITGRKPTDFKKNFFAQYAQEMKDENSNETSNFVSTLEISFDLMESTSEVMEIVRELDLHYSIDSKELLSLIVNEINSWDEEDKNNITPKKILGMFIQTIQSMIIVEIERQHDKNPEAETLDFPKQLEFGISFAKVEALKAFEAVQTLFQGDSVEAISAILDPQTISLDKKYAMRINQKLIKYWGWEENILQHLDEIDQLCDGFYSTETSSYLTHYSAKLLEELGWDFVMEESVEDMANKFHQYDQECAKESIEQALKNAFENEDREKVIVDALKKNGLGEDFTWDAGSRYTSFVIDYIEDKFISQHAEGLERLKEEYGESTLRIIINWFGRKYWGKFIDSNSEEEENQMNIVASARIEELKQQYLKVA